MKRQIATFIVALLAGVAWQALSADALWAQDASQTPRDAGPAANGDEPTEAQDEQQTPGDADPAASDGEPTEADIRDLLVKESIKRYRERWGARQTYLRLQKCKDDSSGYIRPGGPALICNPADVTPDMIQEHRQHREHLGSTFLNEPQPKF